MFAQFLSMFFVLVSQNEQESMLLRSFKDLSDAYNLLCTVQAHAETPEVAPAPLAMMS